MGFIDTMRAEGHAVESICRVLREQGCQVAARTYRSWSRPGRRSRPGPSPTRRWSTPSATCAWTTDAEGRRASWPPEGLYGRRKMTAPLRRTAMPEASCGAVDRAMRTLGLSGVRRDKGDPDHDPGQGREPGR